MTNNDNFSQANSLTVEFSHMYTADYCLLIVPRTVSGSRKPLNRIFRLFSTKQPIDVSTWRTTMDLQAMHYRFLILYFYFMYNYECLMTVSYSKAEHFGRFYLTRPEI